MRALTLYQPWGWFMLYGPKRIENRKWRPPQASIGNRIWVHQGKHWDDDGAAYIKKVMPHLVFPELARATGILGSFRLDGVLDKLTDQAPPGQEEWFFGRYGWLTSLPLVLPKPVPCRGALSLWHVPDELHGELLQSLGRTA